MKSCFTEQSINKSLRQIYPKKYYIPLLILISTAMLVTGLFLPTLTLQELILFKNTFSVLSGILVLWKEKEPLLALIILLFSVVFPFTKLICLFWIWFVRMSDSFRNKIINWLETLGKWSMLDVFVVAITVVAVKFGIFANAKPRAGIYVFASSILLAMITTAWVARLVRSYGNKKSDKFR